MLQMENAKESAKIEEMNVVDFYLIYYYYS